MPRALVSLLLLCGLWTLGVALRPWLGEGYVSLIFVLAITVAGAISGLMMAVLSAVAGAVVFNYFVSAPLFDISFRNTSDFFPPVVFGLCALISGLLSGRLRDRSWHYRQSTIRLEALLDASRALQQASDDAQVFAGVEASLLRRMPVPIALYRLEEGALRPLAGSPDDPAWRALGLGVCDGSAEFLHRDGITACVLSGGQGPVGALVAPDAGGRPDGDFMLALARIIGLALERTGLVLRLAEVQARVRSEELKSALLASVSHDLRTPLTAISASAASLLEFGDRIEPETAREMLSGVVEESQRLNHLMSNLLELTRLQGGAENLRRSLLPAIEMLRKVLERQRPLAGGRQFTMTAPRTEALVEADAVLFELVLSNVLQNAIRYSPEASEIRLDCEADGDTFRIAITDEGPGIPAHEQAQVFERFYRGEAVRRISPGSGIGLTIAKGFVEASGGGIELVSPVTQGRGTRVTIVLPLAEQPMGNQA